MYGIGIRTWMAPTIYGKLYGKYTMKGEIGKDKVSKSFPNFLALYYYTQSQSQKGIHHLFTVKIHIHRPYDPIFATTATKTATSSWICLLGVSFYGS